MKTNPLIILVLLISLFSCSKRQENMVENTVYDQVKNEEESSKQTSEKEDESTKTKNDVTHKKIIKDGSLSIKTKDLNSSKKNIDVLLARLHGYYETENLVNSDNSTTYTLKVRIPAEKFERFISELEKGKEEIESKNIQARDVTSEYFDAESRLLNKREYLKRYKVLLAKASTIKDILSIEEAIRILQEEIESKEGILKYLNDQISFSTLDINLYQEKAYKYKSEQQNPFWERLKRSLDDGWNFFVGLILWLISIWPLLLILIVSVTIIRRVKTKRKNLKS